MTVTNAPAAAANTQAPKAGPQSPAESTNTSANLLDDFSNLLTEMIGNLEQQEPSATAQANAAQQVAVTVQVPPEMAVEETETEETEETEEESTETKGSKKSPEQEEPETTTTPEITNLIVVPVEVVKSVEPVHNATTEQESSIETNPALAGLRLNAETLKEARVEKNPEMEKAWADVRRFEFKVENEAPPRPAQPLQELAPAMDDAQKQLMITTDPMINLRQDKLPPRIVLVQNNGIETRLPERSKSGAMAPANENTTGGGSTFSDVIRSFDQVEQARPAHAVEMPDLPQLKVVRSVSMEVGDADSQVVIRIQERSGDVSLQLNAANEPMRHNLASSVSSLLDALKQQDVKVSNVDVFRKSSPIDKVRRMKEAR